MTMNNLELRNFLNEMHHSDMVRGMFMVLDNVLRGVTVSESNNFSRNDTTQEITLNVSSKVASFSGGMFHLAKYDGNDTVYFIVGNIINDIDTSTGYVIENLIDFLLEDYNMMEDYLCEDEDEDEPVTDGVVVFRWNEIVACLNDKQLLRSYLIKISQAICKHQSFLLEYGDMYGFLGLGEGVLDNDDYTDNNFELLFGAFVKFVDSNIIPKLNITPSAQ